MDNIFTNRNSVNMIIPYSVKSYSMYNHLNDIDTHYYLSNLINTLMLYFAEKVSILERLYI